MERLDIRRLTGPNLHFDAPCAVLDVACEPAAADGVEHAWRDAVTTIWTALRDATAEFSRIDLEGGVSLAFTAPPDALYLASEVNELAYAIAAGDAATGVVTSATMANLFATRDAEHNPALLELSAAAAAHDVTLLWDDDEVSLGMGRTSAHWPARALPALDDIDWNAFRDIPVALVTGTNGKTTTVRLAQHLLRSTGRCVGVSSTDWIAVDDRLIDRGDWSGPGGARTVLRQPEVDTAILEAARGGLLRRGLGVQRADVALITNVSADHLGDFGSRNLVELLQIKWLVSRAVRDAGTLVLNADDELLVAKSSGYAGRIDWFAMDATNPVIARHREEGGRAFIVRDAALHCCDGESETLLCRERDIPLTMAGLARHNTENALAAAALCAALGVDLTDIRRGLTSFSPAQNPGRGNVYTVGKRRVLVDFAHNPEAMRAVAGLARRLPARRRALCFGQAGDRPDELIRAMTREAWDIGLDRIYISELAEYYRGRAPGEVFTVIRDELLRLGASPDCVEHHSLDSDALGAAMLWAGDGDLVIMLALGGAGPVVAKIEAFIRATGSASSEPSSPA